MKSSLPALKLSSLGLTLALITALSGAALVTVRPVAAGALETVRHSDDPTVTTMSPIVHVQRWPICGEKKAGTKLVIGSVARA